MSQQEHKKPDPAQTDTAAPNNGAQNKPGQAPQGKDPDEYDPVGMAGKKAGILLELGEEANAEAKKKEGSPLSNDKADQDRA